MKTMCLIGKNISHSSSPELYNNYFANHKLNFKYYLNEIENKSELKKFMARLPDNLVAFNITMPHKSEIIKCLDYASDDVRNSNSCNLVIRKNKCLFGYNTDGIGLFDFLKSVNIQLENKVLTIIGYGGAGRSIDAVSKYYGISNTHILKHDDTNMLFKRKDNEILKCLTNSDILINASNTGFSNDNNLPMPEYAIDIFLKDKKDPTFIDIIYNPLETRMLKYFRSQNVYNSFNGEGMLKKQFEKNIEIIKNELL